VHVLSVILVPMQLVGVIMQMRIKMGRRVDEQGFVIMEDGRGEDEFMGSYLSDI